MKLSFVFPGQGSQFAGMGRELYISSPAARAVFDAADRVLGFPLTDLCFNGPEDQLGDTQFAQPAIFTVSIAYLEAFREWMRETGQQFDPDFVAGHSLGEYSALVACGSLAFEDGLRLVWERGRLMHEAGEDNPGGMAAVIGLAHDRLMQVGVERLPDGLDRFDALALEHRPELPIDQPDALDPWVVRVLGHVLEGTIEVVEDRQQLADQDRIAELADRGALLVGSTLEVREVGRRALPVVKVLLVLGAHLGQLTFELLDALGQLDTGWRLDRLGTLLRARLGLRLCAAVPLSICALIGHWGSPYSLLMSSFMSVEMYRTVGMARG